MAKLRRGSLDILAEMMSFCLVHFALWLQRLKPRSFLRLYGGVETPPLRPFCRRAPIGRNPRKSTKAGLT
jgi:hypothetical protein